MRSTKGCYIRNGFSLEQAAECESEVNGGRGHGGRGFCVSYEAFCHMTGKPRTRKVPEHKQKHVHFPVCRYQELGKSVTLWPSRRVHCCLLSGQLDGRLGSRCFVAV